MFNNRRTSQKPGKEFYAAFKQSFPEVGPGTSSAEPAPTQRSTSLADALLDPTSHRHFGDLDDIKDQDATPKGLHDGWRFTPSLMDPNSFAFSAFANQPPGYYTPTPGGINTLFHSAAGDLHTPGMGMNTPLSMPHSVHAIQAQDPAMHLQHFPPQLSHQPQFHHPFAPQQHHHHHQPPPPPPQTQQQQQSYAPSHFLQHQDSGYAPMDSSSRKTTPNDLVIAPTGATPGLAMQTASGVMDAMMRMGERFRFHVTLNAATAMIRHADEIPITYLNKGQAYTISVFDTVPLPQTAHPIKYRTFVRVSFEDEQQRARPGACWQLWKEGRGMNEAHQRGGKLLAVEYVDPSQGGDEESRKSQVELQSASFDGFCVTWTLNPATGTPDCAISVRFNFLSTDFSHSKGVKGIPVRLCAKTEMISPPNEPTHSGEAEVCFSKVKLFRDHGAERKLSNDVAHVKKTIDKLNQQITQAESGMASVGKRKRSSSTTKSSGVGKIIKHKRTWSMDSDAEMSGRLSAEEDLHMKLAAMQDMFSSARPASVLYLKGEPEDDPDLYPVQLSTEGQEMTPLTRQGTWDTKPSATSSPSTSQGVSPTPSSLSNTTTKRKFSDIQQSTIPEDPAEHIPLETPAVAPAAPEQAVKVQKRHFDSTPRSSLLALDVDADYQPPADSSIKPKACFYVRSRYSDKEYYRAVYVMQRSVRDLVHGISQKFGIEPSRVTQVTHTNSRGLQIIVDEDVVRELPEGQDMVVEFTQTQSDQPVKQEFIVPAATEIMADGNVGPGESATNDPLEMWLNY